MAITFAEFKELPKKNADRNNLEPGKKYYIQDTSRRSERTITVYIGTFLEKRNDFNNFSDVEFVVAPYGISGKPFGFNSRSGFKFMEVVDFNPSDLSSQSIDSDYNARGKSKKILRKSSKGRKSSKSKKNKRSIRKSIRRH